MWVCVEDEVYKVGGGMRGVLRGVENCERVCGGGGRRDFA